MSLGGGTKPSAPLSPAEQVAQRRHEVTVAKFIMVAGIGTTIAGSFAGYDELTTAWDNYGIPVTSALYIFAGLIAFLRPKWVVAGLALALVPTSIYQQGVFYFAVHYADRASYYSAAGSGAWFPLFYVALFIAFPRGAAKWSWAHYALFVLQFILNHSVLAEASPSPAREQGEHLLVEVLMAHPAYILALSVIANLRDRLHLAQEEAFRSKESFLAMLSHEIRNLMQTMVVSIEMLERKVTDPQVRRLVARLSGATGQLQTYLRDIVEFTRLEDPAMQLRCQPFNAVRMLTELREEWLPAARERGLSLQLDLADGARERLRAWNSDEGRIRQILANLVSNGLKYTPTGGVTIHATVSSSGGVRLEVSDSGIGIEEQALAKIFQPYVRLEDAKRHTPEGSGLGLAVVQRLVERLGGSIRVSSQPGQGSRFTVDLPG